MTREEAINICKREQYCASHSACPLEECPWNENCPDDAPFDSEIQEAFQMAIEALKAQQWISCSERLPYGQTEVIVSCCDDSGDSKYNYTSCGWMTRDGEYWIVDNEINSYVIAWMPLPEPYREETE